MTELTIVPAGAGAGKTHRIQTQLADWVVSGDVAPGRILAVTFTEAAASELRGRVRGELMARGRVDDALQVEQAYMGTIHALGQRLLTEHAFAAGRSPESRLLSDPERDMLIRMEVARCAALAPLTADLSRFGYRWDFLSGASAEESFRADLLRTVDLIRGLGERGLEADILAPALDELDAGYGEREAEGAALTGALRRAAQGVLARFPDSVAPGFTSNAAITAFDKDHGNLTRAATTDALARDWRLWQNLRGLRMSKRGAPTPEGYDALAEAVIAAADALPRHPGPLEDAKAHLTALVTGAQQVLEAYQASKARAGLIDYADMIVETEALLRRDPMILDAALGEIDCVVIDEFQDTNPVQFALLWRLARGAKRALIVGDTKQSIMGFQGADARLSAALQAAHPETVDPLDRNWRSVPQIMEVVNTLGPVLFPQGYGALAPTREASPATSLEAVMLPSSRKTILHYAIADRVETLLADQEQIIDKDTKQPRVANPADVAVLCYSHAHAALIARALRDRGLPVRIQQEGWLQAPVVRAARAALALAADPTDRLAALSWLTLGPAAIPLEGALANAVDGSLELHAGLDALRPVTGETATLEVGDLVARVVRTTGLRDWAAGLAEPEQALADLARLEAEARDFDRMAPDLRAAAGFHGYGVQIFLGWIMAQTDRGWDRRPDPDGWHATGIEVCTWHAAKGREWPVTVVAGLDKDIAERPGTLRAEFARFDDLDEVLDDAGLGYLPDFVAPEVQAEFADSRRESDEAEATRLLYVALTRARDRLILVVPPEKSTPAEQPERMIDILRHRAGLAAEGNALRLCGKSFSARVTDGIAEAPEPMPTGETSPYLRFGLPRESAGRNMTAWRRSPSSLEAQDGDVLPPLTTVELAAGVDSAGDGFALATDRGTAWHLAFRVLVDRPDRAGALAAATGLGEAALEVIGQQAAELRNWLADQGYDRLYFELPLQESHPDGSETNAIIDCLAEGPKGLIIVDHKSGPCPDAEARFAGYLPQLSDYARLLGRTRPDKPVRGIAINWMNEGRLSVAPYDVEEV